MPIRIRLQKYPLIASNNNQSNTMTVRPDFHGNKWQWSNCNLKLIFVEHVRYQYQAIYKYLTTEVTKLVRRTKT